MKRNQNRVRKNGSRSAAHSQAKTGKGRPEGRPPSASPSIALFPEGDGISDGIVDLSQAEYAALKRTFIDGPGILMFMANAALEKSAAWSGGPGHQPPTNSGSPSCLCFFDAGVGELAGEIPLVGRELPSVAVAAYRQRITVDQFIADAIKSKLGSSPGKHATDETGHRITASVPIKFRVRTQNPEDVIELKLDEDEAECMKRAAASARLSLKELFHFIFLRQMESFNSEDECYTVFRNAQPEVSSALERSKEHGIAVKSLARAILKRLEDSQQKSVLHDQIIAWGGLIFDMASYINRDLEDGIYHWKCHVVPALLERKVAPGAQAAA